MNESILIQLKRNAAMVPIDRLTPDGIEMDAETDSWPRGLAIRFDASSPITKLRMDRVRQTKGWGSREFKLITAVRDNALVIQGVDRNSLPPGHYWFELQIGDLILPERISVELREGKETVVELETRNDPRQVEPMFDSRLDAQIGRVLSQSKMDGVCLSEWIGNRLPRPSRKACVLNLLAKLRSAPAGAEPLLAQVRSLFLADVDHCYGIVSGEFFARLKALAAAPERLFAADKLPVASIHRKLLRRIEALESDAAKFRLHNFRQTGNLSLQILIASPPGGDLSRPFYADFDIDLGNPMHDLRGFFIHIGELLSPGKTDHLKLRQKLAEDPSVREFLYYRVLNEG